MKAKTKLWKFCEAWAKQHRVHYPESIYQSDRVQEQLEAFAEGVFNIVGYCPTEDE